MRIANLFSGLDDEVVQENVPLKPYTWYKIGGPARWFIRPRNVEELQEAAKRCTENDIPIYVLGLGANLLVSDEGVNGAVFRLDHDHWRRVKFDKNVAEVGAGVDMQKLIIRACRQGLAGIESLAGIPGTVGGGVRMNAGGKFGDIGAVVTRVQVMDAEGILFERFKDDLVFEYRSTNISAKFILGATLELDEDDPDRIMRRTKEIWMYKRNTQPLNTKNCGCIFKNPRGLSAGALIDQTGPEGHARRRRGSERQARELHRRAPRVQRRRRAEADEDHPGKVYDKHQVQLDSEVQVWS
jgi:UDP-N-acetylmuramate dehydrogenase